MPPYDIFIASLLISNSFLPSFTRFILFIASSADKVIRSHVSDHRWDANCQQWSSPLSRTMFSKLSSNTASPRSITVNCLTFDTVSRPQLLIVLLTIFLSVVHVSAGTIHVKEVLSITHDSNFDGKLLSSHIFSVKDCGDIESTIVRSTCSSSSVKKSDTVSPFYSIPILYNEAFSGFNCIFYFLFHLWANL